VHRREDTEPRGRFGLPPEQPARRELLSPARAFIVLASAGLLAWLVVGTGSPDAPRHDASVRAPVAGDGVVSGPPAVADAAPTEAEALETFRGLDRLRSNLTGSEAGRVLVRGLSLRGLQRTVPSGGRTLELEVLSVERDQARIRQVIELSEWDVDLTAEDLSIGRAGRRLGVEWTLVREDDGWRIAAWTIVEDRAVVAGN
jgi:hypothetical protein